jgi:hypothetical protein
MFRMSWRAGRRSSVGEPRSGRASFIDFNSTLEASDGGGMGGQEVKRSCWDGLAIRFCILVQGQTAIFASEAVVLPGNIPNSQWEAPEVVT